MIGRTHTTEYTITHRDGDGYFLEKDGVVIYTAENLLAAHTAAKRNANKKGHKNAGLTEAFGCNRQFILGPRGGWHRPQGEAHA